MTKRLLLLGTLLTVASVSAGAQAQAEAPVPDQWGAQPVVQVTEVIRLGNDVLLTLLGTPGVDSVELRFQRRGANSVLSQCSQLEWRVDGATASMPVTYASENLAGGIAETLSGSAGSNNTTHLGSARVVSLSACGASFAMTPAQLGQFADFSRRLNTASPTNDANGAPQQQQPAAAAAAAADGPTEAVFVAPEPAPVAPAPAPVVQTPPQQQYVPPTVQPTEDETVTASRSGMIFGAALMGVGLAAVPWWISRRRVLNETCPCLDQQRISRSRWAAVGISLGGLALGGLIFAIGVKQRLRARRNGLTSLDLEIRGDGLALHGSF